MFVITVVKMLWTHVMGQVNAQQILTTVMRNIIVTKSAGTDHTNHCGFVFYHNSVHDQDCDMLMQAGLTVPLLTTANWPFRS